MTRREDEDAILAPLAASLEPRLEAVYATERAGRRAADILVATAACAEAGHAATVDYLAAELVAKHPALAADALTRLARRIAAAGIPEIDSGQV